MIKGGNGNFIENILFSVSFAISLKCKTISKLSASSYEYI